MIQHAKSSNQRGTRKSTELSDAEIQRVSGGVLAGKVRGKVDATWKVEEGEA